MSQPPRPAQEAQGPARPTLQGRQRMWLLHQGLTGEASTERRTPALEDKSKFLGCGWGWGQGVYVEGREEHAQHFHFSRKTAAFIFSLISLLPRCLPRFNTATSARPLRDFPFPRGEARGPSGPTDPGCAPHLSARVLQESPPASRSSPLLCML